MLSCFCFVNREIPVLRASFLNDKNQLSVVIKNEKDETLATISPNEKIQEVLRSNPAFDATIERRISRRVLFSERARAEAKIQEVAKLVFSLADTFVEKEVNSYSIEGSSYRDTKVLAYKESDKIKIITILKLCPYEEYSNKDWFKTRARYVDAAVVAAISQQPCIITKPNTCYTKFKETLSNTRNEEGARPGQLSSIHLLGDDKIRNLRRKTLVRARGRVTSYS